MRFDLRKGLHFTQFVLALPSSLRQRRLAEARPPLSTAAFVDQLVAGSVDRDIALLMRGKLDEWICIRGFDTPAT